MPNINQTGPAAPDWTPSAGIDVVGGIAARHLIDPQGLIVRHVESLEFENERDFKRRLTIDFDLPRDIEHFSCERDDGGLPVFELPLGLLDKDPARSNIDLVDEGSAAIPLRTRFENAEITHRGVLGFAKHLFNGQDAGALLEDAIAHLVHEEHDKSGFTYSVAMTAAFDRRSETGVTSEEEWERFGDLLFELQGLSLLWVPIAGRPGSRRLVKLRYDAVADLTPIVPLETIYARVVAQWHDVRHEFEYQSEEEVGARTNLLRFLRRAAVVCGWSPIDWRIDTPHLAGCASYHLQIEGPQGLLAQRPDLVGPEPEVLDEPSRPRLQRNRDLTGAHLYVAGVELRHAHHIEVAIRASRRGFLFLSFASCVVTALLLWAFALSSSDVTAETAHFDPAAAVLVLTPALLAVFVVRPGEHELATRLLSGVRMLVLFSGLLSVTAAAALAGVRFEGVDEHDTWTALAWLASAVAWIVGVAYRRSFESRWDLDAHQEARRGYALAFAVIAAVPLSAAFILSSHAPGPLDDWPLLVVLLAVACGLALKATALGRRVPAPPGASTASFAAYAVMSIAVAAAISLAAPEPLPDHYEDGWLVLACVFAASAVIAACVELIYQHRRNEEFSG